MNKKTVAEAPPAAHGDSQAPGRPSEAASDQLQQAIRSYRGLPGGFDEAVTEAGQLRPGWQPLMEHLAPLPVSEMTKRVRQAQRQVELDGVVFNPHDTDSEVSRPWSLDPIPLVLPDQQWKLVAAGLQQRAHLADLILLDLLGPQTLLHEHILPPELLFANPRYYPSYHGLVPRPNDHLHLYAADLARSPDGSWLVTADRTRAPSGLGYVLENRLIASSLFPVAFANCNVLRLASFFITFRRTLKELAKRFRDNPRIAIWSKGPTSKSYFEDAFLARYLGYTLVESDDLAVRNNCVMLKTLSALLPVEVLFRRIEDHRCDPTELDSAGDGVSGLLEVVRGGNVSIANSLGSSYAESPALMAFLPGICQHFLGEDLKLPSVATWWCGDRLGLDYVLQNLDHLVIRPAYREKGESVLLPDTLSAEARQQLVERIKAAPHQFVGQQRIVRSTTPVWENGQMQPWSLALRAFLSAKDEGFEILPGALARVSPDPDVLLNDMTSGEKSQDVWIVAEQEVQLISLLGNEGKPTELQRGGSELPSRVADNLYWFGRNLERAEQFARLIRTTLNYANGEDRLNGALPRLVQACLKEEQIAELPDDELVTLPRLLVLRAWDASDTASLRHTIHVAHGSASKVRDRIALDSYRIITELKEQFSGSISSGEDASFELVRRLDAAIQSLSAIAGLAGESMTRTLGWRFFDLGRRIERAHKTTEQLICLFPAKDGDLAPAIEAGLQLFDSFMTYRSRYLANIDLAAAIDLLLVDETNPRSIVFQLRRIHEHVEQFPRPEHQALMSVEQRAALSLYNTVRLSDVFELANRDQRGELASLHRLLRRIGEQLPKLSDRISGKFLIHAGLQRHYGRDLVEDLSSQGGGR